VRDTLEAAGLTLYRVSALTSRRRTAPGGPGTGGWGPGGMGAVTHTLYRDIRAGQVPSVYQLAALSRVTRRPIAWWLAIFGIDLSALASLQIDLHRSRTVRVPAQAFAPTLDVSHWTARSAARDPRRIVRLVDGPDGEREIGPRSHGAGRRFHYFRTGAADSWLAPELAVGSIVRVDVKQTTTGRFGRRPAIHAVAHAHGVSCCYVDAVSDTEIALFGPARVTPLLCRLGSDAVVLGRVEVELRLPGRSGAGGSPSAGTVRQSSPIVLPDRGPDTFGRVLRRGRALTGVTFREAHGLTERIAERCGDDRFRLSLGALCNYETLDAMPGSPHALFSLAAIYAIEFRDLLGTGGLRIKNGIEEPSSASPFLPSALGAALGAPPVEARDLYVWGSSQRQLDPRVAGAVLVAVDRRDRRLAGGAGHASTEPPLFMLRLASDAYICCAASLHESCVLVHPSPELGIGPRCLPREQVEVMGRVSVVLRRLAG
jgi:hypothetical protein